jgi:outer membrane biosynthesis protein TonB
MSQQHLGKYSVLRRLGAGGMAEVFLCKLQGIGGFEKHVVLKRIREDAANDVDFVTMFFDEARLAANLNHPNIVQTFEVDQLESMPYIAMEYVKGATLAQVLRKVKQEYRKPHHGHIASIFAGVCAGLDYAHNAKDPAGRPLHIVHRDISPQNIMVSLDGIAKIFDFGIAKAQGSLALTGIDRVKGKFAYMAPEQLRAKPVNAKADVFAVGVCLYEATTGKKPFAGQTEAELLAKRLEGTFAAPSEIIHKFPAELEQIILDAMASAAESRPTALELHQRLTIFCGKEPFLSNTLAVGAWMREMFEEPKDDAGAYETFESSAAMTATPMPSMRSAPERFVARHQTVARAPRSNHWLIGGLLVATAVASTAALIRMLDRDDRPAPVAMVQPQPQPQAQPPPQPEPKPAPVVEAPKPAAATAPVVEEAPVEEAPVTVARKSEPRWVARKQAAPKAVPKQQLKKTATEPAFAAVETKVVTPDAGVVAPPPPPSPSGSATTTTITITTAQPQAITVNRPAPSIVAPVAMGPGSMDATPVIQRVTVDGSLTTSEIESALGRTLDGLRSCYRSAASSAKKTPDLTIRIAFEIDEGARASRVRVGGDSLGLAGCVSSAVGGVRTRVAPDVGTVAVTATIRFKPLR